MEHQQFRRRALGYARQVTVRAGPAGRKLLRPENSGFAIFFILCILTIALTWLGFAFQQGAGGPAQIPDPPLLTISFQPGSPPPQRLFIYSFLEQTPASARLVITADGIFRQGQKVTNWTIGVQEFTGYLCSKPTTATELVPLSQFNYYMAGQSALSAINGAPFLTVRLCWNGDAPLITSGSYISAALSPILTLSGQAGTVTRSLVLSGTTLSSYALAGGIPPTEVTSEAWVWSSSLSDAQSQVRYEIPVIASSLPGIQRDNKNIFYSGIFFGIAGGAAISLIPALFDAVGRRKKQAKETAGIMGSGPTPDASSAEQHDKGTTAESRSRASPNSMP